MLADRPIGHFTSFASRQRTRSSVLFLRAYLVPRAALAVQTWPCGSISWSGTARRSDSPVPREIEPPERGPVRAIPPVGGLHRRYTRAA